MTLELRNFENLPSQFGITIVLNLPNYTKFENKPTMFKEKLKIVLNSNTFYIYEEFFQENSRKI